ncbi:MAG: HAD family hydrolase [Akkermansiaceae bacterium]
MALSKISGIKHLAFDLYGTLLTSHAGGSFSLSERERTLRKHLNSHAIIGLPSFSLVTHFENLIAQDHAHSRRGGIDFPEVEIRKIWARFFESLRLTPPAHLETFIIEYEDLINPVALIPGALKILAHPLSRALVSNAQFYTPLILKDLGIPTPEVALYSYETGHAKPGTHLFEKLTESVPPSETLYVGNDRLKDIAPAHQCGFRTALFSGDSSSYRPYHHRNDLPEPNIVIKEITQILEAIS